MLRLRSGKFKMIWRCLFKLMIVWSTLSCVVLFYHILIVMYKIKFSLFVKTAHLLTIVCISHISFALSFIILIIKRNQVLRLLNDVLELCDAIDTNIMKRLYRTLTIVILFTSFFCLYLCLIAIVSFLGYTPTVYDTDREMCFGCNLTSGNVQKIRYLRLSFNILHVLSVMGVRFPQIILYCFLTNVCSNALAKSVIHVSYSNSTLAKFRKRMSEIRQLVDRINSIFENIILSWLGSTLLASCSNANFLLLLSSESSMFAYIYSCSLELKDLTILISLTLFACRVNEENSRVSGALSNWADNALAEGNTKELLALLVYSNEFKNQKMAFQAGSCIIITKHLLLTFLGLAVTYTVIFIQFNPDLLQKMNGI